MRTIQFHSEQKMAPAVREILSLAVRGVFGSEKVKFQKVETPDPNTLCFGTRGGIRTMSPKQILSAPNALSVLEQSLRLAAQEVPRPKSEDMVYAVVDSEKDLLATLTWMVEVGFEYPVCADIENAPDGTVLSIAVTYGKNIVVFPEEFCQQPHLDKIVHALWTHYYLIGANWKYDSGLLLDHTGMMVPVWFDTMLAHHSLHPSATGQHGLKQMAERILGVPDWDKDIQKYTGADSKNKPKDFSKVPREILYRYNAYDVYYTFMLYEYLLPQIQMDGPYWTEQYWANGFTLIENNRVHLDIDAVVNLREHLMEQEAEHEAWLAEFGIANVRSPKQVKNALTSAVPTLAGTDKATLEAYQDHEEIGEAVTHLLEYRSLQKQRATYCDAYLRFEKDGFIHPTINIHGTASGRMSGSEPNCVSGDTEVLTPQGWVRFDAYEDGTEVFQVDAETGVGTFVLPEKVHRVQTEKFFEVAAEWGTFLYTPDHRIPSYNREGVLRWDTAQTWADQWEGREVIIDRKVRRAATKESVVPTSEDLRALHLAIIVQAEGYFMPRKRVSDKFEISVTSERKRRQLHEVFGDRVGGNERRARVVLDASEVGDWISQDAVKVFNAEKILTLPSYLLDWFVQMVMIWDGDSTRGCTYGQTGQRKKSVDVVQAAAALCGRSTSIYENPNNDIYTVNVHQDALRHQSRTTIAEVTGGAAFCVTVPTGAFMIRRGGAVLVTGNCQNVPRDKVIRNLFTARSEDRVLISCDYSQAELRAQAILSGDERMIAAFQPGAGDYFDLLAPIMFPREFENLEAYKALKVEDKAAAKEFRAKIKGVIYGSGFGRGAAAIGRAIGSTKEEAQTILDNFLNGYPDYKIWRQKVIEAASNPEKREFLTGPYNLIFDTEVITWRNRSSVERSALSFLPQNIVSYLCTTAAVRINDRLRSEYPDALVVMAVHDDILVDCPKDLVEPVGRIMQEEMIRIGCETYGDAVLFDAEPESTYRWGALVD